MKHALGVPGNERDGVLRAWRKTLEASPTSDDINFFDAGGNSILLVRFQQALLEEFGFKIPVREIFAHPTIAELTGHLQVVAEVETFRVRTAEQGLILYCLPYAGCSARVYDRWKAQLPESVIIHPLEFPGRGSRCTEKPVSVLGELLEDLAGAISTDGERPFVLFGHSFGALIAYELAQRLLASGRSGPEALLVSACRAPHLATPEVPVFDKPDEDFKRRLAQLRGTPEELLRNDELMELYIPVIRADYTILDRYRVKDADPLTCPVSAFYGSEDADAGRASMEAWQMYTRGGFAMRRVTGDHFFLHHAECEVIRHVCEVVDKVLRMSTGPSIRNSGKEVR